MPAEGLIQIAQELSDAPSTRRSHGVAFQHVYDVWRRAPARVLNVLSADRAVGASEQLGRLRRVGRCPENVLHLVRVGEWM